MRKATNVLLTISKIVNFVLAGLSLLLGLLYIILANQFKQITEFSLNDIPANVLNVCGIILIVIGVISFITAIFSIKASEKFRSITSKSEMRPTAILLIVLGCLTSAVSTVAGIFMLAMNESCYYKQENKEEK